MKKIVLSGLSAAAIVLASTSANAGLARGHLYSTAAVNRICKEAQQVIANTTLESTNVIWDEFGVAGPPSTGFISSDALPYQGAESLPLTTQQFVTYATYADGSEYPKIVSCKMKRWDALQRIYGASSAASGSTCRTIVEGMTTSVIASLTNKETREVVFDTDDEVVEDPDSNAFTGAQWTNLALYVPANVDGAGVLHLRGRRLDVPENFPAPFLGPAKKGVTYCHLPAPEYIRALLTGEVTP
jgi:lambda repressor-like predicted transcriptional regulator